MMDIDDQLQLLQRQLMAVQEQKTNPLSQRTVAQIMVKLYHNGFAFIPTTDGNQYVTPDQLDKEISALVKERGKIGLNILPQLLNIGTEVIEGRVNHIIKNNPVTKHGRNLFSHRYFDNLILALTQRLEEEGRIDIEQIAIENELQTDFAQNLIADKLHLLKAELDGKQLITREYTFLEKAKILGFLSAIKKPLQIEVLYKAIQSEAKNAEKLVHELINQGKVNGRFANGYFIPASFTSHQKRIVSQFLSNNGYLDADMLQRKFMIARPEEWIEKNLDSNQFVKIEGYYFKQAKLEHMATQINSLLKTQGFVELSQIMPLEFDELPLNQFLEGRCGLKDYFLCEGYCYSNQWLQRLASEFKHKIVYSIFFSKKPDIKDKKKKGKKQKIQLITQEQLKETLFNGGFADYTMAQNLAPELHSLMLTKLEEMKKAIEKDLTHNKGLISSTFLKYKSCKTILKTEDSLNRTLNIIQKQQNKGQKWNDQDFGPNQQDALGAYAVIYYDNILPKGWPAIETFKWQEVPPSQLLTINKDKKKKAFPMHKCMLVRLLELISFHNKRQSFNLPHPEMQPLKEESSSPYIFRFFLNENQKRYVIVDNLLPFSEGAPIGTFGPYAFVEKAYAKLRYCYKGIIGVGIQQILLQVTGKSSLRYFGDTQKERQIVFDKLHVHLKKQDFIVIMAEGEADKQLKLGEDYLQLQTLIPYIISGDHEKLSIYPSDTHLTLKQILDLFRNIFIIQNSTQ